MLNNDVLQHEGVQGQKWYERRYQNPDGTYTELGKARRRVGGDNRSYNRRDQKPLTKEESNARREAYYDKKEAIRAGDVVYASKHIRDFSNQELDDVIERYYKNKKISEINSEIENAGKITPESIARKLSTFSDIASSIGNISANLDKTHKAFNNIGRRKKDPDFDKKNDKKDKKKKKKDD